MVEESLAGRMLIATPDMGDPRFEQAVIFVCQHDEEGAMGVIVNKPLAELTLSELLEQLDIEERRGVADRPVMFGGPVQTERGVVVHSLDYRLEETLRVTPEIGVTTTREALVDLAGADAARAGPKRAMMALGYAGWGPEQLETEISQNAWQICEADEALLFDLDRTRVWRGAFAKLGVSAAMLSDVWSSTAKGDRTVH
ncbi:MAG: YqgE/AlgH family protein [Pseudomonadota bacterium]